MYNYEGGEELHTESIPLSLPPSLPPSLPLPILEMRMYIYIHMIKMHTLEKNGNRNQIPWYFFFYISRVGFIYSRVSVPQLSYGDSSAD